MKRRHAIAGTAGLAAALAFPVLANEPATVVQVFRSSTCGCCGVWGRHMRAAGFEVRVADVHSTAAERKRLGMPAKYGSCHTATVGGYVLEGHVPPADVKRLLASGAKVIGLAVPGMPMGSPGMEAGAHNDPYDVLLVDLAGQASIYARYPK